MLRYRSCASGAANCESPSYCRESRDLLGAAGPHAADWSIGFSIDARSLMHPLPTPPIQLRVRIDGPRPGDPISAARTTGGSIPELGAFERGVALTAPVQFDATIRFGPERGIDQFPKRHGGLLCFGAESIFHRRAIRGRSWLAVKDPL